jgi:outer membrane murein-binding lipoprotein Lpp
MKKVIGILFTVVLASVVLTGCYSKSCGEQPAPCYKDEAK